MGNLLSRLQYWIARTFLVPKYASECRPTVEGTLKLPQLEGSVRVLRDQWGIPHIFAETDDDAYFVQVSESAQH